MKPVGTANSTMRLTRLLQRLFSQQAREVASRLSLDDVLDGKPAPDLTHWVGIVAEASKPVLLETTRLGMAASAARIAAKVGAIPDYGESRVRDRQGEPVQDRGLRTYRPGNDTIFGPRETKALAVIELPVSYPYGGSLASSQGLWYSKSAGRIVAKAKGKDGKPNVVMNFDLYNPRIADAVDAATFRFCRETNETATMQLDEALAKLRELMKKGTKEGDAKAFLAQKIRTIFSDPMRAFRLAVTEDSRAVHGGQLLAAAVAGYVVLGHGWHRVMLVTAA